MLYTGVAYLIFAGIYLLYAGVIYYTLALLIGNIA